MQRNLEKNIEKFRLEKQQQHELLLHSNYETLMISRVVKKEVIDIADLIDNLS
jgi:hypothetical protein